ncbi:MFS transporter [Spongiactinospora gelatinilytica]|uniref:MFS transporter n=1 Tax=Spongiactinospora gelatinilytica TaxID=2666298 RepID=UPI0018F4E691|nr:MFS transporter [Spongiactinospora gelatinilytica]
MTRRLYAYAFLDDFILLYPVYALLFAKTGLSAAQISTLFVIWSVASFAFEVPSGLLADLFSRRLLLVISPIVTGAGYALWTFLPGYPSFAAGFVLWGAGTALTSGAWEALVYEELARIGRADSYARVIGRARAMGSTAILAASALAAPVLAWGGHPALGAASIAVCLLGAVAGMALPETRASPGQDAGAAGSAGEQGGARALLRDALAAVRQAPALRLTLLLASLLTGVTAIDEYLPMLAAGTGVALAAVPLLVLVTDVGAVAGGWLAGRGTRWLTPVLALAAVCLAVGAATGPAGFALVGVAFGGFRWAMAAADARLQEQVGDRYRATITSAAGFGSEVVAVLLFAAYGAGSAWAPPWQIFAAAAVPYLLIALGLRRIPR